MQGRAPAVVGPAHHQIAEIHGERAVGDRHWHPPTRSVHNLKTANIVVAVQQRHHAEVAMRSGAQLPGQGRDLRRRIMHDAQLADVPVDFVFEEFRRQIECFGKEWATRSSPCQ